MYSFSDTLLMFCLCLKSRHTRLTTLLAQAPLLESAASVLGSALAEQIQVTNACCTSCGACDTWSRGVWRC